MEECQAVFEDLKKYLGSPPLLSKPTTSEVLYLYLAISVLAASLMLIQKGWAQKLIYYASKALRDAEIKYSMTEKMILALFNSVR